MKNFFNTYRPLLFCFMLLVATQVSYAQCNAEKYKDKCINSLPPGFNFKQLFNITSKANGKQKIEFSTNLKRGHLYMINVANKEGLQKNIVVKFYDAHRRIIATNYDDRTGKFWPIGYACNSSGVYFITFEFINNENKCGIAVLGER